jgi:hypothetical protein
MHPIDQYETLRRGREELLRRAEYERLARKALLRKRVNWKMNRNVANWFGTRLVRWGEKLAKFGAFARRQPASSPTTRVRVRTLSKTSPHH